MQRKTKKWLAIAGALLVIGGIGSLFEDDTTADTAKPAVAETTPEPSKEPAAEAETDDPAKPSAIPSPNAAQTADLIAALRNVDPGLVVKEDRAVSRARNICMDIHAGEDGEAVRTKAVLRYEGGTVPSLSDDQGEAIVKAVKSSFCD
ncbi:MULTISPECIES: hypothetical protein [Streptomyces]|uniref:hypothetical protein n=1 Tax=Streptomyces TaxID=1883 RepID=UPI00055C04D9|nr:MULTISPECIES: hypothetical protein [Streptomyces]RZE84489.1 hypothetical protein C0Q99_01555 [Streptomyces albidoflavus]